LLTINSEQAVNAQVDVLCHELAHVLVRVDRHEDDPRLGYAEEELVAESVAHLAVSFVGVRSDVSAVPYLAVWSEDAAADTFEQIAVSSTAWPGASRRPWAPNNASRLPRRLPRNG
jgi:hypothetical protein